MSESLSLSLAYANHPHNNNNNTNNNNNFSGDTFVDSQTVWLIAERFRINTFPPPTIYPPIQSRSIRERSPPPPPSPGEDDLVGKQGRKNWEELF